MHLNVPCNMNMSSARKDNIHATTTVKRNAHCTCILLHDNNSNMHSACNGEHQNVKGTVNIIHLQTFYIFVKGLGASLWREIAGLCSDNANSFLRDKSTCIKEYIWEKLPTKVKKIAPTLFEFLRRQEEPRCHCRCLGSNHDIVQAPPTHFISTPTTDFPSTLLRTRIKKGIYAY